MLNLELEALLGVEGAGEVTFEVSSPGAERQLQLPSDLERFQKLPLKVEYKAPADGAEVTQVRRGK
jgi:ribosome maturation factor RimP